MFPRLKHRFGPAFLERLDVIVELSTLGEYGVDETGRPMVLDAEAPAAARFPLSPRQRGDCTREASPRRCAAPARS